MASKALQPHALTVADKLLASSIILPDDVRIISATFFPSTAATAPVHSLELARRAILSRNQSSSLLESFLTNVRVAKTTSGIYAFRIVSPDAFADTIALFQAMRFDGLAPAIPISFRPRDISSPQLNTASSHSLDGKDLRYLYSQFIQAVRNSLIDDLVKASLRPILSNNRTSLRLQDSIILSHPTRPGEWGTEWEYHAQRPFVQCTFQISLLPETTQSPARLIVHPLLSATPHLPLLSLLPLPAGTPIHLLPHGTPAYFLAPYKGPTSGLVSQFNETFLGHGVAGWDKDIPSSRTTKERGPQLDDKHSRHTGSPAFVIAWISVENKQGEEKGLSIIWPTSLCAASLDPSPRLLSHIPELPTELQPSPPPVKPTSTVSESGLGSGLFSPLPGALTPSVAALSPTADVLQPQAINDVPYYVSQLSTSLASSPTSDTLRAFRSLTVTRSKKVPQVAAEVGEYVGHVARERERQRDQMRKDRELQASPGNHRSTPNASSASITATTPSSAPVTVPAATVPSFDATTPDDDESHDGLFYPSPPQTHPPVPIIAMLDLPQAPEATPEVLPPAEEPAAVDPTPSSSNAPADTSTFNPFGNIDMSWSEPIQATGDDFLDMDMNIDFGMSFNMDMNNESTSTNTAPARTYQRVEVDYDDPFTEDDFSYFDSKPSKPIDEHLPTIIPSAPTVVIDPLTNSGLAPAGGSAALGLGWSPPSFGDLNFSGPGPPQANSPLKMHWPDGFTPRFGDAEPTPALSPPSPGQSPMSNAGPLTPVVHIEDSGSSLADVLDAKHGSDLFGPIPFADTHKFADGKYTVGKFSLPPASEDAEQSYQPPGFRRRRSKYEEATDPRVGLVRKLIGVKRKSTSQHAVRRSSTTSFDDEWEVKYDTEEPESEVESDPGDVEETDSPLVTRPSTPPPSYLPLGPSLLHTQFHHSHLLPLSTPLRPPNMVVAPPNISTVSGPMFAPTPVSPAAALGAASEKSKSLEAAAVMISKEVVENSIWADAWFATDETNGQAQRADPWHADINYVFRLLSGVASLQTPLDLQNLWGIGSDSASTSLRLADMPSVVVSKNEAVVEVLPTVIRFWEKLAVGPKGGTKDITAYVLFEEEDESQTRGIEVWLQNLSASYQDKHLGLHVPGRGGASGNGLLPIRFDQSFRKNLGEFSFFFLADLILTMIVANIVGDLPSTEHSIVFYVVTPTLVMSLSSPHCRQMLSGVKKAVKTYSEAQVLFHFVPESLISGTIDDPAARFTLMEIMCANVYNRLTRPVDRTMSRHLMEDGPRVRTHLQDHAVTLARRKVCAQFAMSGNFDVMDRHTLLHVGYQISQCGKWIIASCIDERGEMHDKNVWLTRSEAEDESQGEGSEGEVLPEAYVASKVWGFAMEFASRANVDWRIVITKLGVLNEPELQAWLSLLVKVIDLPRNSSFSHVSVLCARMDTPWQFLPSTPVSPTKKSRSSRALGAPLFVDISANMYTLLSSNVFPLSPSKPSPDVPMVMEAIDSSDSDSLPIFPLATSAIIRVPNERGLLSTTMLQVHLMHIHQPFDIVDDTAKQKTRETQLLSDVLQNFVDLAYLAALHFLPSVEPILPFHLAAVNIMSRALTRDKEPGDDLGSES